ncbi:extracellular calcium-sensing receptor-like isoform X2 [Bolinopsis microptera]|uniref:extracellular calcium-sensing receptor-like isoform X2 n=1 Tax=Bolinopsis microptera TaxID=2820187 RepID=UPI003079CB96
MINTWIVLIFLLDRGQATNKRFIRNIRNKPLHTLAGLFPVSKHVSPDLAPGPKSPASNDGVCEQFENDGWYMMLAMDFAIEKINERQDYNFELESIKLDTCGTYETAFWLNDFTSIIQSDQFNVSGIVGASYSSNSKIAAHASTMYEIPMISYQSSATSISDTYYFPFLFRTIPIDDLQAIALKNLLAELNLTYIALFYDSSSYGVGLKEMLDKDQKDLGPDKVCLLDGGYMISLDEDYTYKYEINKIIQEDTIGAIAVFGYKGDLEKVKAALNKTGERSADDYIWIASDGWAQFDTDPGLKKVIGTTFNASILANFSEFYDKTMDKLISNSSSYHENDQTVKIFKRFQDNAEMKKLLTMDPSTEDKISYITPVVEAVFAFAEALNNESSLSLSTKLQDLHYNVSKVFEIKGNSHSMIERLTYGDQSYGAYSYSAYSAEAPEPWVIGSWQTGDSAATNINQTQLKELLRSWDMTETSSECEKCKPGWVVDTVRDQCCYDCVKCEFELFQYTKPNDFENCHNCSTSQRAINGTGCEDIAISRISFSDPLESTVLVFSFLGIICVSMTYWYMFVYNYSPIARASGRSYMLLVAICTCLIFTSPLVLFAEPSKFICMVQRVVVAGPTVGIIAACLVRTFSIDRIFRHPGVRQRLLSKRLVLLTIAFLIVIELFIESIIIVSMPSKPRNDTKDYESITLECKMPEEDIMLTFIFPGMLTILCGIFALRIRKVPSNYNESRYIIFTITILTFESVIFFMSFKELDYISYIRYSVVCIIVGDYMTYFALFLPRLYIIIFKPERNTLQLQCSANGQFLLAKTVDRGCNTSLSVGEDVMMRLSSGTEDEMMTKINDPDQRVSAL